MIQLILIKNPSGIINEKTRFSAAAASYFTFIFRKKYITEGFGIWSTEDFKKFTPVMKCTNPILGEGSVLTTQTVDEFNHFIFYRKSGKNYVFDEKNERALFISARDNNWPETIKIVSLRSGKELFSAETNFRELFVEDGNVYLSVQNKLFKINYTEEDISLNEVKTFVPQKEKIIAMGKKEDIYVLRTEYCLAEIPKYEIIMHVKFRMES